MEIAFRFGISSKLRGMVNWQASRLTGVKNEETGYHTLASFNLFNFGLGYEWQHLDNLLFPTRGYNISVESQLGKKKILPETISDHVPSVSPDLRLWQQSITGKISQYHPFGKSWVLFHELSGGALFSRQLFMNDLFRLGGLHSIRGFYDNFFFASQYGLSNLEFRLIFDEKSESQSYLFLFYDQAYMKNEIVHSTEKDYPAGIGGGINLATPAGLFSLVYGLGRTQHQPFNVNLSKIHFGYISRF